MIYPHFVEMKGYHNLLGDCVIRDVAACSRPSQNRATLSGTENCRVSSISPTFNAKITTYLAPLLCKLAFFNRCKPNTLKYVDIPPRPFEAKKKKPRTQ
uniref:Uncharacterized protein n=1 Tax=Setaria italica TaxID=4555 RepID=K3YX20_SETIT